MAARLKSDVFSEVELPMRLDKRKQRPGEETKPQTRTSRDGDFLECGEWGTSRTAEVDRGPWTEREWTERRWTAEAEAEAMDVLQEVAAGGGRLKVK